MCDEYARIDAEKLLNNTSAVSEKIVYDCIDYPATKKSDNADQTPYIDENEMIELPPEENPVDHRKYYPYGPQG